MKPLFFSLLSLLLLVSNSASAEPVRVAVAANFAAPLKQLVSLYQQQQPDAEISVTVGSTGKLAAQIRQGAPYDIFLAADNRRPRELAAEGLLRAETLRSYALGILVLWSPQPELDLQGEAIRAGLVQPLALANARTAPYGEAAEAVLAALQVPASVTRVNAESVGQSYHFARSGAAAAAFVALSQVQGQGGSQWRVADDLYAPIIQQGGLLSRGSDAEAFFHFLFSAPAASLIRQAGYGLVQDPGAAHAG